MQSHNRRANFKFGPMRPLGPMDTMLGKLNNQQVKPDNRQSNPNNQQAAVIIHGKDHFTSSMITAAPPQKQKQMLGETLFPLIHNMYPDKAGKITGMLLELDKAELLPLIDSHELLQTKVGEIMARLQEHNVKKNAAINVKTIPKQEPLTSNVTRATPRQKQMLGETLFPLIHNMYPDKAGKITGMLLELDKAEILHLINSHELLLARVEEAIVVLQEDQAKKAAATHIVTVYGQEPFTSNMTRAIPLQKQMLGETLFPLIHRMYPDLAGKITGMLLELDKAEILHLINSRELLQARVEEAISCIATINAGVH